MKLSGLLLLYENKEIIVTIIILSIIFFIYWDKKNKENSLHLDEEQTNSFKEKWYDVSQMDIISSKVGVLFLLLITSIFLVFKN